MSEDMLRDDTHGDLRAAPEQGDGRDKDRAKLNLLNLIRVSINDGLRFYGPDIDDRWLEPVREFRQAVESEIEYLHGDEPTGPITHMDKAMSTEQQAGKWQVLAGISPSHWVVFKGDPLGDDYEGFLASTEASAEALAVKLTRLETALREIVEGVGWKWRGGQGEQAYHVAKAALASSATKGEAHA